MTAGTVSDVKRIKLHLPSSFTAAVAALDVGWRRFLHNSLDDIQTELQDPSRNDAARTPLLDAVFTRALPTTPSEAEFDARKCAGLMHADALIAASTGWSRDGTVESTVLLPPRGVPILLARSHLACSAARLFQYLVVDLPTTCHEWNDAMYHSSVLQGFGRDRRLSTIISSGQPLWDREDVFLQLFDEAPSGTLHELSTGVGTERVGLNASGRARRPGRLVRSRMPFACKRIAPRPDGTCDYITVWQYDPAGALSALLPCAVMASILKRNLVHEHLKLAAIFGGGGQPGGPRTTKDHDKDHTACRLMLALAAVLLPLLLLLLLPARGPRAAARRG